MLSKAKIRPGVRPTAPTATVLTHETHRGQAAERTKLSAEHVTFRYGRVLAR